MRSSRHSRPTGRAAWRKQLLDSIRVRIESLTAREREVMAMVTAGLLNKQIAGELNLSEITVKMHRRQVMEKMRAGSLAELVKMCERVRPHSCRSCERFLTLIRSLFRAPLTIPRYRLNSPLASSNLRSHQFDNCRDPRPVGVFAATRLLLVRLRSCPRNCIQTLTA